MHTDHLMEKRREYRVPMAIPVTFFNDDTKKPLSGYIENISSNGALVRAATSLPEETFLKLFFETPATGEQIETGGAVRWWCKKDKTRYLGIKFQDKVSFNLPLYEEVVKPYAQKTINPSTDYFDKQSDLLQKSIVAFQHLTYWGRLSWTFSESIHRLFSQLAGQLGLSLLRFEKFYKQMEKFPADSESKNKAMEAISTIELVSGKFNEIATVFGSLKEQHHVCMTKSRRRVDLNRMIKDKINSFQNIIIKLTDRKYNINYLPKDVLPSVYGQYSDFVQSIHFLLLYSYQSMLLGNCTGITVQSTVKNQTIQIDFFNDGSKIFEEDDIVISDTNNNFMDQLTPRDVNNILELYYSLVPLKKYKACIVVHSESGNNIVSLRIPI